MSQKALKPKLLFLNAMILLFKHYQHNGVQDECHQIPSVQEQWSASFQADQMMFVAFPARLQVMIEERMQLPLSLLVLDHWNLYHLLSKI